LAARSPQYLQTKSMQSQGVPNSGACAGQHPALLKQVQAELAVSTPRPQQQVTLSAAAQVVPTALQEAQLGDVGFAGSVATGQGSIA
jgi:hypothetical protein